MTSHAKLVANRANALRSTGPRSSAGKDTVAHNAITHGIFAAVPVVKGESAANWEAHRVGILASLNPVGLLEHNLAENIALLQWRIQRLYRYEAVAISAAVEDAPLTPTSSTPGLFDRTVVTQEIHFQWLSGQYRSACANLSVFIAAAHFVRHSPMTSPEPMSWEHVDVILRWCEYVVEGQPFKAANPAPVTGPEFLPNLGLPPGSPHDVAWTVPLLKRVLAYFAGLLSVSVSQFAVLVAAQLQSLR